jgi:hypothetical protein
MSGTAVHTRARFSVQSADAMQVKPAAQSVSLAQCCPVAISGWHEPPETQLPPAGKVHASPDPQSERS